MANITTIKMVGDKIIEGLKLADPQIKTVFDPLLSYESAIATHRIVNLMNSIPQSEALPMLVYNRSALVMSDELKERGRFKALDRTGFVSTAEYKGYIGALCKFDLNFSYITDSIEELDAFEIYYCAEEGLRKKTFVKLNLTELGEITYRLFWNSLKELKFSDQENYFMAVSGSIEVTGVHFMTGVDGKLIEEIDVTYYGKDTTHLIETDIIT